MTISDFSNKILFASAISIISDNVKEQIKGIKGTEMPSFLGLPSIQSYNLFVGAACFDEALKYMRNCHKEFSNVECYPRTPVKPHTEYEHIIYNNFELIHYDLKDECVKQILGETDKA